MSAAWRERVAAARARLGAYAAPTALVFAAAAYLCLANLGYAALWHDEAPTALIGKNLLERGDIVGWDGRNLVGGTNGRTLNDELRDVLPPLTYAVNAAAFAVLGVDEAAARIGPALLGIAALGVLLALLRQHLPGHPRLVFLCFVFAALSPQLLLFFRQSRYYAGFALGTMAAFWLYERYWRTRRRGYLAALWAAGVCAFLNHYTGAAATVLAVAAWHALLRGRETAPGEWLRLGAVAAGVAGAGAAYLVHIGVVGGERAGFAAFTGVVGIPAYEGSVPPVLLRLGIYARDLFAADWVSWPVFVWFLALVVGGVLRGRKRTRTHRRGRDRSRRSPGATADELPVRAAAGVVLMGALVAGFCTVLSVQPVWAVGFADLRYLVGALPLLLAMKGLFAEWVWRRSRIAGAGALAVLVLSSAGAAPFNQRNHFTHESTLGLHLFAFVGEIHRPYRDGLRTVGEYLLAHAEQDDLVLVPSFSNREALTFAAGRRVLFCCVLDADTPLPAARVAELGAHLRRGTVPDWIVLFGPMTQGDWDRVRGAYAVAAQFDVLPYPTQRPELNVHAFRPLSLPRGVTILRRREGVPGAGG